ncbi:ABC transporter substrate-binding protein [Amycolatopsis jejuensis]|uniref:ABC transporter substrate-binding protein n=1 Tax=Amycolatopsis jejuensis TaxID=330084 RepID=UPI000527A79D|nr:ABC transporter substrate-binding protein [Amycolatopsis jejuensis]
MGLRTVRARCGVLAAAAALLVAAGCGTPSAGGGGDEAPARGGTLAVAVSDVPDSWNPQEAQLVSSYQVFAQVFAALLRTSPDGKQLLPGLASSYQYDPAKKTLTFTLDPAAKFSTGAPVTSADVKFSFGLWRAGELYGSYFESVHDVLTPDPHTAVFELSAPDKALIGILATSNAAIFPVDYGGKTAEEFWKQPVGAGPFAIESQVPSQSINLTRNEHYYRPGLPRLDKLDYKFVTDSNQQLLQFQSGQLDLVNNVEAELAGQYQQGQTHSTPSSGVSVLVTQASAAPLDNPKLRKALTLAIDHRALVEGGYVGHARQATSLLPQVVPGVASCAGCDWGQTDLAKAKQLVAESGYTGAPLHLIVSSDAGGPEKLAAQAIVPMAKAAGINVEVTPVPSSTLLDKLGKGDFQLGMFTYSALAPSPLDPLGYIASSGFLYSKADQAPIDKVLATVHAAADDPAVTDAVKQFEQYAYDSTAVIPLAVPDMTYAVSDKVHGFVPSPYEVFTADELWVNR